MSQTNILNLFQQDFVLIESVCTTAQKEGFGHQANNTAKNIKGGYGTRIDYKSPPPCVDVSCPVHSDALRESFEKLAQDQGLVKKPPE